MGTKVQPVRIPDKLDVERKKVEAPGKPDIRVDVNGIAQFCRRGPKDCDYATDQMLLKLRD